jgi:hypothetical protein
MSPPSFEHVGKLVGHDGPIQAVCFTGTFVSFFSERYMNSMMIILIPTLGLNLTDDNFSNIPSL